MLRTHYFANGEQRAFNAWREQAFMSLPKFERWNRCYSSPEIPDQSKAAIAGATQDLKNYPLEYQINQLANMGGKATINGKQYDFTGMGEADVNSALNDQMAQVLLDIQRNYGADYVKQRLADLKQSNPTGYAARQQLFDRIMADVDKNPDRPLADDLQKSINDQLEKGGHLTGREQEQVQQGVRGQQLKSGIFLGNAPIAQEAGAVESAGEQMRTQRQGQAENYLTQGISPEDVSFRRIQQSLQNLGAFVNGTNPIAEFQSLSGAQNGAAPFTPAPANNASINLGNSEARGVNNAFSIYNAQQSQANPYMAGLSTGVGAYGAYNQIWPSGSGGGNGSSGTDINIRNY